MKTTGRQKFWVARIVVMALFCLAPAILRAEGGDEVSFNREVRPLLSGRCFKCHGPDKQEAGLRLDLAAGGTRILESGLRGVAPGRAEESEILQRIRSDDPDQRMPPADVGDKLSAEEIDLLRRWIEEGANWETHWAYIPPQRPSIPALRPEDIAYGPIDALLARTRTTPIREADPSTLIRRLSLDLVGLPPTPDERRAFMEDSSPDAYERAADRLLASPEYGVRQALPWLDLARYADTDGYAHDFDRAIWPYRDWVVDALNDDLPFDRFTIEQLAGDLLPEATDRQRIATGLHRNTRISTEAGSDPEEYRIEAALDRVNTTATIWLGSTVGCAQCHTHKFDPFTHEDYYRLLAFFNQGVVETTRDEAGVITNVSPRVKFFTPDQERERADLRARRDRADDAGKKEIDKALEGMTPLQTLVMQEAPAPRKTFVFVRGSFLSPGPEVSAGIPRFLEPVAGSAPGSDRLALATWLVDERNPLVARVVVNRAWSQFLGSAFVDTLDDLGTQAPPVRQQELLDWLAVEFRERGWSLKQLHREIVTSATYRQSSHVDESIWSADPVNRQWERAPRIRLPAEIVRDNALAIAGLLRPSLGGKSQPAQRMRGDGEGDLAYRRSLYIHWKRGALEPTFVSFDAPTRDVCTAQRERTNTPIQSLDLLNNRIFMDAARALAARVLLESNPTIESRAQLLYELTLARLPTPAEIDALRAFLDEQQRDFGDDPTAVKELVKSGTVSLPTSLEGAEWAAWTLAANAILNLDETQTRE